MIGVFDSGIGGLSVLREMRARMPEADFLYLADQARAPYGPRSLAEVEEISLEIGEWLLGQGATTLVVACNTASAAALETLRARFTDIPIVGMEPAVKPAAARTASGVIAVFATAATFQGRLFESVVSRHGVGVSVVSRACPDWVEIVERGEVSGPEVDAVVAGPVSEARREGADVAVLGCTHFSFLAPVIGRMGGAGMTVIDPAPAVAAQAERVAPSPGHGGVLQLVSSGDPGRLAALAREVAAVTSPLEPRSYP